MGGDCAGGKSGRWEARVGRKRGGRAVGASCPTRPLPGECCLWTTGGTEVRGGEGHGVQGRG